VNAIFGTAAVWAAAGADATKVAAVVAASPAKVNARSERPEIGMCLIPLWIVPRRCRIRRMRAIPLSTKR
jgi:hypothetical protein